jgi:hypothetical protein
MSLPRIPIRGKTGKLRKAIEWLNKYRNDRKKFDNTYPFDYPDYWNLPKSISDNLDSEDVDYIQDLTEEWVDYSLDEQEEQEAEEIQNAIDLLKEHCYTVYDPNGKDLTGD